MEQIGHDVKRTHPNMHFFCGDSSFAESIQVNDGSMVTWKESIGFTMQIWSFVL
jgi:hypothetical protein